MSEYKFNPADYGYEPASLYPELSYILPIHRIDWFIKVIAYDESIKCYWFSAIRININTKDERVEIYSGSHDFVEEDTGLSMGLNSSYIGLISTDQFAKDLLSHIFGCITNNSVLKYGVERLNNNINQEMRDKLKK